MPFIIGQIYTASDIQNYFGGSIQPSIPLIEGSVKYCKFQPDINIDLIDQHEVWIEEGPNRVKAANKAVTLKKLPIFIKKQKGWLYMGQAEIEDITNTKDLNKINIQAPRDQVVQVLKLNFLNAQSNALLTSDSAKHSLKAA